MTGSAATSQRPAVLEPAVPRAERDRATMELVWTAIQRCTADPDGTDDGPTLSELERRLQRPT